MSDSDSDNDNLNDTVILRDRSPIRPDRDNLEINRERIFNNRVIEVNMANLPQAFHLNAIPNYDGDRATLAIFISACDRLLDTFTNRINIADPNNEWLLRSILSKLEGRARILIGSREDANNWPRIKELLLQYFSDHRNEDCLVRDLMNLKPRPNEQPYQFGMRIQDVKSLLQTKIRLTVEDENERLMKNRIYDNLALQTYLHGLQGQLGLAIRLQHPENLESAMSLVIEEENFMYAEKHYNKNNAGIGSNLSRSSNNLVKNTYTPSPSMQINPMRYAFAAPQQPQNAFAFPQRPVNPFNSQQRPMNSTFAMPQQTRNQFFQQPRPFNMTGFNSSQRQHVMPQRSNQEYTPTPMETSTRNATRIHSSVNHRAPQNNVNNQPRRTFISEELYHQEIDENPKTTENQQNNYFCAQENNSNFTYETDNTNLADSNYFQEQQDNYYENDYTYLEPEFNDSENFHLAGLNTNQP